MNKKYFTRDRTFYAVLSAVGTGFVFVPWGTSVFAIATWSLVGVYGLFTLFIEYVLFEGSERAGLYAAVIANRRMKKKQGLIGQALEHFPPAIFAAAWMWTSHLALGTAIGVLWFISTLQTRRAIFIWNHLDEELREVLLKTIRE